MLRARLYELELQKREAVVDAMNATKTDIGWGHQIRSYVLQPYQMVKDCAPGCETGNPARCSMATSTAFWRPPWPSASKAPTRSPGRIRSDLNGGEVSDLDNVTPRILRDIQRELADIRDNRTVMMAILNRLDAGVTRLSAEMRALRMQFDGFPQRNSRAA